MATNDFLAFATAGGANVESQAAYSADTSRTNGNQPGVASSALNNKALRQANYIVSQLAQTFCDTLGVDCLDDATPTKMLNIIKAMTQRMRPVITSYTSGSGTHNLSYYFFIVTGSATAGATYTNNGVTYTVGTTVASATLVRMTGNSAPTVAGTLTKTGGTGDSTLTFYAYRFPVSITVQAQGGGGGGAGSGTAAWGSVTAGGNTTFGTTLIVANGGGAGCVSSASPPSGGTASLGTGVSGVAIPGADGTGNALTSAVNISLPGSPGAVSAFGGAGRAGQYSAGGGVAQANSGSGGGGAGTSSTATSQWTGGGGAAGGYVQGTITSPLSTYAYAVGAAGSGGSAGTSGQAGGAGAAGVIIVSENFQ